MELLPAPNCSSEPIFLSPQLENPVQKKKKSKKKSKTILVNSLQNLNDPAKASSSSSAPNRKRNNAPGVRIRGGRVFDSENGKTCHQCRQKTMDYSSTCKEQRKDKPCKIMFCYKCLFNRYGEKAEEANLLDDWKCPKCRDICNCSFCMKKRGHQPTGILVHTAKATGFCSVLEMLTVTGPENIPAARRKVSSSKLKSLENGNVIEERKYVDIRRKKRCKKECLTYEIDLNISVKEERVEGDQELSKISHNRLKKLARAKKIKESKWNNLENSNVDLNGEIDLNIALYEDERKVIERVDGGENMVKRRQNKLKKLARAKKSKETKKACWSNEIDLNVAMNGEKINDRVGNAENMHKRRQNKLKELARFKRFTNFGDIGAQSENNSEEPCLSINSRILISEQIFTKVKEEETDGENWALPLCGSNSRNDSPEGKPKQIPNFKIKTEPDANFSTSQNISLTSAPGIELPAEDVLQFLEFCNDFGEELLSKQVPDVQVLEPTPGIPLEMLASWCNFVHMIS